LGFHIDSSLILGVGLSKEEAEDECRADLDAEEGEIRDGES